MEPRGRDLETQDHRPHRLFICPRLHRVALLFVDRPEHDIENAQSAQGPHTTPFISGHRCRRICCVFFLFFASEIFPTEEVNHESETHPHTSRGETVMPAQDRGESAADEAAQDRAEVDTHVEDGERTISPLVTLGVQPPHLRGDVRLECAVAEDEEAESDEERGFDRHDEVAHGHENAADDHRLALSEPSVGDQTANDWREVHQTGVPPVDDGCLWLCVACLLSDLAREISGHRRVVSNETRGFGCHALSELFLGERGQQRLDERPSDHRVRVAAAIVRAALESLADVHEQVADHVELEQPAHAVEGEALPHLGEEENVEPDRVSPELLLFFRWDMSVIHDT